MSDGADLYLRVREREGRLYPDQLVGQLPRVPGNHPLEKEWRVRAASSDRLARYLSQSQTPLTLLDLGCGNGWMTNRLARAIEGTIVGLDRYSAELRQARRVFGTGTKRSWVAADIYCSPFARRSFDLIVIASAIQYFADLKELIQTLLSLLARAGEIHILDSPLYTPQDLPAARKRSRKYYESLGLPEMADRYHHHTSNALEEYNPVWLYTPEFKRNGNRPIADSPFPWVCLRPDG